MVNYNFFLYLKMEFDALEPHGFFHFFVSSSTPPADPWNCVYLIHNRHKNNTIYPLHFLTMCKYNPPHGTGVFYILNPPGLCQIRGMRSTSTSQKIPNPSTPNCVKSSHNSTSPFENHFDAYSKNPHTKHSYKFFDNLILSYISPTTIKNPW